LPPETVNLTDEAVWKIHRRIMTHHEAFEQLLLKVIRRSPKHYAGWLTMTQRHRSITPMSVRVLLWSMREDRIISHVELMELLAQLDEVTWTDQPMERA
jgi:hypothetical protein